MSTLILEIEINNLPSEAVEARRGEGENMSTIISNDSVSDEAGTEKSEDQDVPGHHGGDDHCSGCAALESDENEVGFHVQMKIELLPSGSSSKFLQELIAFMNQTQPNTNVVFSVFARFAGAAAARAGIDLVEAMQLMVIFFTESFQSANESKSGG